MSSSSSSCSTSSSSLMSMALCPLCNSTSISLRQLHDALAMLTSTHLQCPICWKQIDSLHQLVCHLGIHLKEQQSQQLWQQHHHQPQQQAQQEQFSEVKTKMEEPEQTAFSWPMVTAAPSASSELDELLDDFTEIIDRDTNKAPTVVKAEKCNGANMFSFQAVLAPRNAAFEMLGVSGFESGNLAKIPDFTYTSRKPDHLQAQIPKTQVVGPPQTHSTARLDAGQIQHRSPLVSQTKPDLAQGVRPGPNLDQDHLVLNVPGQSHMGHDSHQSKEVVRGQSHPNTCDQDPADTKLVPGLVGAPGVSGAPGAPGVAPGGRAHGAPQSAVVRCKDCGWNFDDVNFLQLHRLLMHNRKGKQSQVSSTEGAVPSSSSACSPLSSFTCADCGPALSFSDCGLYSAHRASVHGDASFVCAYCAKTFKLRGSLLVHERVVHHGHGHTGGKFKCSVCGRGFHNAARKDVHERRHKHNGNGGSLDDQDRQQQQQPLPLHPEDEGGVYACDACGKSFPSQSALVLHSVCHMKASASSPAVSVRSPTSAASGSKQWECDVCRKTFTTKYFLKKHNRLHTGETPYQCGECGRSFTFQQSYHKHLLYHTDEKPYCCSQCGRAFKELSTLQNHERIHSGERPFACDTCGKSFRQRVSFLVHRRIHTGVMPYSCAACGKNFRYRVTQRTHKCSGAAGSGTGEAAGSSASEDSLSATMARLRRAKGRKLLQGRLQEILLRTKATTSSTGDPSQSPTQSLEQLSIADSVLAARSVGGLNNKQPQFGPDDDESYFDAFLQEATLQ